MENNQNFIKITNKTYAVIFTAMFVTTLYGIVVKQAWWHVYTLIVTGILSLAFWTGKEEEDYDDREDHDPYPEE